MAPEHTPELSVTARSLLDGERAAPGPDAEAMARILSRVNATVAAPAAGSAVSAATGKAGAWLAGAAAATLIGGAAWWALHDPAPAPSTPGVTSREPVSSPSSLSREPVSAAPRTPIGRPTSPPAVTPPVPAPIPPSAAGEVSPAAVARVLEDAGAVSSARRAPEVRPAVSGEIVPAPVEATAPRQSETLLLTRAREALLVGNDPALALRRLAELARAYPHGVLAEERLRLRMVALARAGRTEAAQTAAAQFLKRYPSSVHRAAAERVLRP